MYESVKVVARSCAIVVVPLYARKASLIISLNLQSDEVDILLLGTALARARMNAVAMFFGFVVLAGMGVHVDAFWQALVVAGMAALVVMARFVTDNQWRAALDQKRDYQKFVRRFQYMATLLGLTNVAALLLIFPKLSQSMQLIMFMVMLGAAGVAMLSLSLVRSALALYFLSGMSVSAIVFLQYANAGPAWLAILFPVFAFIMLRAGRDNVDRARDAIFQRLEVERTSRALEESRRQAEAASVAKSQFLATMSHEIRTPMNGLLGLLELLDDGTLNSEQEHWISLARTSGTGLIDVINDVLDFSKLDAGKAQLNLAPFVVRNTVLVAVNLFQPSALKKKIALRFQQADDIPERLVGDAVRLRQILLNLVGNAVKFSDRGVINVALSAGASVALGNNIFALRIEVNDTGIGMETARLAELFQPFHQLDQTSVRAYGGTGLGLAIVKRLVDEMAGTISVTSALGQGATFVVEIPFGVDTTLKLRTADVVETVFNAEPRVSSTPPNTQAVEVMRSPPTTQLPRRTTVMVAEDSSLNRLVLSKMCARLNLAVIEVEDGAQAVAAWRKGGIQVILMDCQMPEMDGLEASRIIRQDELTQPHLPRTTIIAVTANALAGDRESCLRAGMDDYLSKPINFAELENLLRQVGVLTEVAV